MDDDCSCRAFLPKTLVMKMLLQALKLLCWLFFISLVVFLFVPLGNARLYKAIDDGDEAQAIQLIKDGVNPNSTLGTYAPQFVDREAVQGHPLHFALAQGLPKVAVALLEAGADPNSRNHTGQTALIVAVHKDYTEVVRALLANGADPNAASSSDGETPLHNGPNGPGGHYPGFGKVPKSLQPEIREMLIKAGAK
jgi:hypothetical protein